MKRVLIITYYWPPSGGSGVQRWVKFAKYLPSEGWQPVVYAPENPSYQQLDETLAADIPPEAEILRRRIREPYAAYRRLMGRGASTDLKTLTAPSSCHSDQGLRPRGEISSPVTPISSGRKSWKQRLSLWIRGNLFVPDPRVGWVRPSVRFLKKYLRDHPVDVIVTTGPPHSMHLIGQRLHKALGTPWVADFRDPWTKMYYLKHLGMTRRTWRKIEAMEQAVLDECSTVLAVTPAVQADFRARTSTPVAMITNGFDESDFAAVLPASKPEVEGSGELRSLRSLRPLPTSAASSLCDNLHPSGPSPCPCPGVDRPPEPSTSSSPASSSPTTPFTITHTGLFAADGNPLTLWKVLGEMAAEDADFRAALRLRLCGKVDREVYEAIAAAGLSGAIEDLGYVDHATAVREQCSATVLLLPLRNDPDYKPILPGKLFEYLASRRPILGIGQEDGAMAQVLRETGAGTMCDWNNEAGIRAALSDAWEQFRRGDSTDKPWNDDLQPQAPVKPWNDAAVARYSRRSLTRELARLLEDCASGDALTARGPWKADSVSTRSQKPPKT